jgi:hypothetical protein
MLTQWTRPNPSVSAPLLLIGGLARPHQRTAPRIRHAAVRPAARHECIHLGRTPLRRPPSPSAPLRTPPTSKHGAGYHSYDPCSAPRS